MNGLLHSIQNDNNRFEEQKKQQKKNFIEISLL